jgi:hypothetical protein
MIWLMGCWRVCLGRERWVDGVSERWCFFFCCSTRHTPATKQSTHDEDELDEEADGAHDHKAEGGLGHDLVVLCADVLGAGRGGWVREVWGGRLSGARSKRRVPRRRASARASGALACTQTPLQGKLTPVSPSGAGARDKNTGVAGRAWTPRTFNGATQKNRSLHTLTLGVRLVAPLDQADRVLGERLELVHHVRHDGCVREGREWRWRWGLGGGTFFSLRARAVRRERNVRVNDQTFVCSLPIARLLFLPARRHPMDEDDDDFAPAPSARPPLAPRQTEDGRPQGTQARPRPLKQAQLSARPPSNPAPKPPSPQRPPTTATAPASSHPDGCPICLEAWSGAGPHRVVALKGCGHLFGASCARAAVRATRRCPLCSARAKPTDVLVLFNVSGLAGTGRMSAAEDADEEEEDTAAVEAAARREAEAALASTRAELAATKAEVRRLARLNARLVALWGQDVPDEEGQEGAGGGAGENEGPPSRSEPAGPNHPPPPAPAALPRLTLAASPPAPGGNAMAVCATAGYVAVGCMGGRGGGGGGGAAFALRIHSLFSPHSPPAVVPLRCAGFGPGCEPGVWAVALSTRGVRGLEVEVDGGEEGGSGPPTTPRAAVLLGWPPPAPPPHPSTEHANSSPSSAAIVVVDLRSGSTVAAWPVGGGSGGGRTPTALTWVGPHALAVGGTGRGSSPPSLPPAATTVFDLVRPPPMGTGRPATPAEAAAVERAADCAGGAARSSTLSALPPLPPGAAVVAADRDGDGAAAVLFRKPPTWELQVSLYVPGGGGGGGTAATAGKRPRLG